MDWREFVETLSGVEQILRSDPADVYNDMDFSTRDDYRHVVERVTRHSLLTEMEVAALAVNLAKRHKETGGRKSHHMCDLATNTPPAAMALGSTPLAAAACAIRRPMGVMCFCWSDAERTPSWL